MAMVKMSETDMENIATPLPEVPIPEQEETAAPEVEGDVGEVASYLDEPPVKTAKLRDPPDIVFKHPSELSDSEMAIVVKALRSHIPIYAIAAKLQCSRGWLAKKIKEDPYLAETYEDAREAYVDNLEFQAKRLIDQGNAAMIMFGLERLGKHRGWGQTDADENREDDSRLVIGAIPEDMLAEADGEIREKSKGVPVVDSEGRIVSTVGIRDPMKMAMEQEMEASGIPPAVPPTVVDDAAPESPQVGVESVSPPPYEENGQAADYIPGPWDNYQED